MNPEFGFEGVPPKGTDWKKIIKSEFISPLGFDFEMPINSGGITVATTVEGESLYGLMSHFDEDTKINIERLCGQNGQRKEAFGSILQEIQPYAWVTPDSVTFIVSQTPVLTISESNGVVFDTHTLTEDGSIIGKNFDVGKSNPARPTTGSPYYRFEVKTVQDEPVLVEKNVEYCAELTAGIKIRTLDIEQIYRIITMMRKTSCMTSDNMQKIVNPYFSIDLMPYREVLNEKTRMEGY